MLVLFKEGMRVVRSQIEAMSKADTLLINSELLPVHTQAKVIPIDFRNMGAWVNKKEYWAIIALANLLRELKVYPVEAFREAVAERSEFAEQSLAAVEEGEK
ncbi:MAG: hypothetical protein A2136_09260 [Chloroflexi bacterium RBG_16_54_11]|nr:MAG: hypothetical protein A2136_09260 [Chloroflexi bacterium RBG_16_54_11]